jgi:hypothetical protein
LSLFFAKEKPREKKEPHFIRLAFFTEPQEKKRIKTIRFAVI